jgi:hypothetical protein
MTELEAALEMKRKTIIAAPKEEDREVKVQ